MALSYVRELNFIGLATLTAILTYTDIPMQRLSQRHSRFKWSFSGRNWREQAESRHPVREFCYRTDTVRRIYHDRFGKMSAQEMERCFKEQGVA